MGFDGRRKVDFSDTDELINLEARSVAAASKTKVRRSFRKPEAKSQLSHHQ